MDIVEEAINFDVAIEMIARLRSEAIKRKYTQACCYLGRGKAGG